jgi:acyl-CoA thioester hydrolase
MSAEPTRSEFRVRYAETDKMGVVYHAHYLVWCEIGRTDHIRRFGMTYAEMERAGLTLAVAEAQLRYHASARYDDLVRVETRLSQVRSRTLTFEYLISNVDTGEKLATASTKLVALDREGRVSALAEDVREVLERAQT